MKTCILEGWTVISNVIKNIVKEKENWTHICKEVSEYKQRLMDTSSGCVTICPGNQ